MSAGSSTSPRSSSASRSCSRGARCPSRRARRSGTATPCPATGSRACSGIGSRPRPRGGRAASRTTGTPSASSTGARPSCRLDEHRPDDLGDHVAGAPDDDRVALAHVLAPDLVLVVQRRVGDGDAADDHRLEHRERRDLAGPPGVHVDLLQQRRCAPPAGTCRRSPSAAPARWRRARAAAPVWSTLTTAPSISQSTACRCSSQLGGTPRRPSIVSRRLGGGRHRQARRRAPTRGSPRCESNAHALRGAERVHPQPQRPRGRHLRVLLPQRARGGVARVRERPLPARRAAPRSARSNAFTGQVHLAADLDRRRADLRSAACGGTPRTVRTFAVMSSPVHAVAARGRPHETPALVRERARHPVDLQLAREPRAVADARARRAASHASSSSKRERVVEREHRRAVRDRREQVGRRAAHALRRRVRRDELGERVLERAELAHQLVVLGVGDLGIVEDVVAVAVVVRSARAAPRRGASPRRARARSDAVAPARAHYRAISTRAGHADPLARPRRPRPPRPAPVGGTAAPAGSRRASADRLHARGGGVGEHARCRRSPPARRDPRRRARGPRVVDTPTPASTGSSATVIGSPPRRFTASFIRFSRLDEVVAVARDGDLRASTARGTGRPGRSPRRGT